MTDNHREYDYQCGRCGSSILFEDCPNCAGEGFFGHDCFDDSCCSLDPEDDPCTTCEGSGAIPICLSSAEWCAAHPQPGHEHVARSTPERFEIPSRMRIRQSPTPPSGARQ